jgi:serine protease Do
MEVNIMNNDNFNSYNNNNPYGGYNQGGYGGAYAPKPQKEKKHPIRALALVLVGAILGSAIGGGAVGLYLSGSAGKGTGSALTAQEQSYIDKAVSKSLTSSAKTASSNNSGSGIVNLKEQQSVDYSADIQSVAKNVMPSVVGVKTQVTEQSYFGGTQQGESVGTGIIVSGDGLILTNQHVVSDNPGSIKVTLMDGTEHDAKVLFSDANMDLAVIKIDATGLTAAKLGDSDNISIGQIAIAIGNPYGLEYQRSVTAGIVSALNRSIMLSQTQVSENLIQTDAAINSGNSGGPLLNEKGEVIGVNSYKLSEGEGMGFAIPINAALPIVNQIIKSGSFTQVQIGASFIDKEMLNYYDYNGLKLDSGLYVYDISQSSDAYAQGLKKGDIVKKLDGSNVNTILELKELLYGHAPGDSVTLTVERNGAATEITVKLSAYVQA